MDIKEEEATKVTGQSTNNTPDDESRDCDRNNNAITSKGNKVEGNAESQNETDNAGKRTTTTLINISPAISASRDQCNSATTASPTHAITEVVEEPPQNEASGTIKRDSRTSKTFTIQEEESTNKSSAPRLNFKQAGQTVVALMGVKSRSMSLREKVNLQAHKSVNAVGHFLGTSEDNQGEWKKKWDKECRKRSIHLPLQLKVREKSKDDILKKLERKRSVHLPLQLKVREKSKDDILKKLEKTVQQLTEETEIEDSKLLEQIASEDDIAPMHFYNPHATDVFQQLHNITTHRPSVDEGAGGGAAVTKPSDRRLSIGDELVTGHEAYEQYKMLIQLEKQDIIKKLKHKKDMALAKLTWQERMLENVRHLATEYYRNPTGPAAKEWKALRLEVKTSEFTSSLGIQTKLAELPTYFPFFTYFIVLVQVITFLVILGLGGVARVGANPDKRMKYLPTFIGLEEMTKWNIPNIWIGPNYTFFISIGAVYAPCMRVDNKRVNEYLQRNYTAERGKLGCCEIRLRNMAGTLTEAECRAYTPGSGNWTDTICSHRKAGENSVRHAFRPCCLGSRGQCVMMTHSHCLFMGGVRRADWEHCSMVNCLSEMCGLGGFTADPVLPWKVPKPSQWWRFQLATLYSPGIIQCVLVIVGELLLMRQLESIAGWLRVLLIYYTCCFASLAAAAGFEPYTPHMGSAGALSGVIGVSFIEMLQSWPIIHKPWIELLKFLAMIAFMLLSGTLPFLSNYGLVFGFITGILSGVILLPYITFGKWNAVWRRIIVIIALPLLLIVYITAFYMMYRIQGCEPCLSFNCIPYTKEICSYTELVDSFYQYDIDKDD